MAKAKKTKAGTWRVLIYAGTGPDGKRHYKSFTGPTKAAAELAALKWSQTRPSAENMTLREAYSAYIESRDASCSESTLKEYERIMNTSTSPLMEKRIDEITLADVQKEFNALSRRYSPKTVRNRFGLFTGVMGQFRPDVKFHVKMPQKIKKQIYVPEESEILFIHQALVDQGSWLLIPFILGSQLGLRESEIAALTYMAFVRQKHRVIISEALVAGRNGQALKAPKSDAGYRELPCSDMVLEAIGTGKPDERIVKASAHYISTAWHRFMEKQPVTYFSFHKLRYFFCSRALLAGIPKPYVAYYMGHAGEEMVNRVYEYLFPSAKERFADALSRTALSGEPRKPRRFHARRRLPLQNATANATPLLGNP